MTTAAEPKASSIEKLAAWSLAKDPAYRSDLARRQARLLVLDSVGCAFAAHDAGNVDEVVALARELGGPPDCTLFGTGEKISVLGAVLGNGALVRVLDLNDITFSTWEGQLVVGGHPSDNIPVALAMGEKLGSSMVDVLDAIIVGYELFGRLRDLIRYPSAIDGTSVSGLVAAAMAGRLLGLDIDRQAHAIALGAARCLTPKIVRKGHMSATKSLANALIAQSGVLGALLAAKGVTGPLDILDNKKIGLQTLVDPELDLDLLWGPPTLELEIMASNVKSFPCIGTGQTAVQAALEAHAQLQSPAGSIERVDVIMADVPFVRNQQGDKMRQYPRTREAADHSFIFLPAVTLLDGELTLRQFANERWNEPATKALMERVTLQVAADLRERAPDSMPCRLRVVLEGGREIVTECLYLPGHSSATGLDAKVVTSKFQNVSLPVVTQARCEAIIAAALEGPLDQPIGALMGLLAEEGADRGRRRA